MRSFVVLPVIQVFLAFAALAMHLLALPSRYWGIYHARAGLPQEYGFYGFWSLCSVRAPNQELDCDPLDGLFRPPPLMDIAGVVAIVHAAALGLFFPLALLRVRQLGRHKPNLILSASTVGVLKISLAIISAVLGALVLVLTTIKESAAESTVLYRLSAYKNYRLQKGWAFWVEVAVVAGELFLMLMCAVENIQLSRLDTLLKLADYSVSSLDGRLSPYFSQLSTQSRNSRSPTTFVNPSILTVRSTCTCPVHPSVSTVTDGRMDLGYAPRATLRTSDGDKCTSPNCQLGRASSASGARRTETPRRMSPSQFAASPTTTSLRSPSRTSPRPASNGTTYANPLFRASSGLANDHGSNGTRVANMSSFVTGKYTRRY